MLGRLAKYILARVSTYVQLNSTCSKLFIEYALPIMKSERGQENKTSTLVQQIRLAHIQHLRWIDCPLDESLLNEEAALETDLNVPHNEIKEKASITYAKGTIDIKNVVIKGKPQ